MEERRYIIEGDSQLLGYIRGTTIFEKTIHDYYVNHQNDKILISVWNIPMLAWSDTPLKKLVVLEKIVILKQQKSHLLEQVTE